MRRLLALTRARFAPRDCPAAEHFTAQEVRARLRQDPDRHARTSAVHAAAADVGGWTVLLPEASAAELGRAAGRLPLAVFGYVRGRPADEIGRGLRPLGGPWDAERAIAVASALIAAYLNRQPRGRWRQDRLARSGR